MTKIASETHIKSNQSWWNLELPNLIQYKDLIYLMVRRNIVTSYKQTVLGPIWVVLQALMGSAIFTVIFGNIAGLSTDGHPAFLFYLCGTLAWHYFGSVLGIGSSSLQAHQSLFSKVYFPRIIPPVCDAISALLNFFIQFIVLCIAILTYRYQFQETNTGFSLFAFFLPFLIIQSALLGLGIGFIISSLSVKYRDLGRLGGLFTQFLMYASPVIYPISEIPEKYQRFLALNPLTFIVESYRYLLLGNSKGCTWQFAIPSVITTCVLFFVGLILYNKVQRTYVDYV